ncbi:MAG: AAA family ATPase [Bacteroidales bacterium]|nr:AAA family ATPase [Bacteroidales bacterium]
MAFKRKIEDALAQWKNQDNRKPLLLRGARQVGKTTLVNSFAKTYPQRIYLNLEKKADAAYFTNYDEVTHILDALLIAKNLQPIQQKTTLLFIDEIQEVPDAIALLRYFYEELPELHLIAAGSLLEYTMGKVPSFPVGRVQYLYLFPLNFQEYLQAFDMELLLEKLKVVPVEKTTHHVAMQWFHQYALIGGMPEVVANFKEHKQLVQLSGIYESIWASYCDDVPKYAKNSTEEKVIRHIMQTAPQYVDKRIQFQGFGNSNYRSREVGESFRALDDAKIIQLIYPGTSVEFPLLVDYKKSPRLQFLDTGILNVALGIQSELLNVEDLSQSYRGALVPHIITQELISLHETSYKKPNFWVRQKKDAQAEVDLIYSYKNLLIPIEIKSGKVGTLRSLHQFVERAPHPYAVRMYAGDFSIEQHTTPGGVEFYLMNLPYYLATYIDAYLAYFTNQNETINEQ